MLINNFNYKNKILETILNIVDCHVYWKNRNGVYLWCNKKFATILGLKNTNDIIDKTDYDLYSPELAKLVVELDKTIFNQGKEYQIEEIGLDLENKKAIYLSIKTPIKDNMGNVEGLVGVSIDITASKQAELAKQNFIRNMAHDIRTPLSGIIGIADIQANQGTSPQDKQYGIWILNASRQLLELLNAVLEVIATERLEDSMNEDLIELPLFVKELYDLIRPAIIAKNLKFEWILDSNLPSIISDQVKLKRILLNLLSNAIKFTNEGEISLEINLLDIKNKQAKIEIYVRDTGIGISKNDLIKIFDRFYRARPSYEAEYTGYGIGLFLVKKAVELLNGKINVSSEEGIGSCFTLVFKFPLSDKKTLKPPHEIPQKIISHSKADTRTGSVLVVEDNALILHAIKNILINLDYEVTTVTEGKKALDILKTKDFSWILLDIGLPDLEGTEVTRLYRQWEQENTKPYLPIFALTAHREKNVKDKCKAVGIDYVFKKPFTEKDIKTIMQIMFCKV